MIYHSLYEFTDAGLAAFRRVFTDQLSEDVVDPTDEDLARRIAGTREIRVQGFETAKELAAAVLSSLGSNSLPEMIGNTGLWSWLTFVLRDQLFPKGANGRREFREVHRWYPSDPNDWQKAQRHLVRMPVLLHSTLGDSADHLLCGPPQILPEIREQLTSQQDMFHPTFQATARSLYFDDSRAALRRGVGGKRGGSARRLAKVRQQLDVTWDLYDLSPERLLALLPTEFDRFKSATQEA